MAASLRSRFEEHLTCSVCLEQLNDPKVLPCLHSFCHQCIVNLARKANSNDIHCPECRKVVQIDNPDNPSNLPSNFFVNNLLSTMALTDEKKEQKIQCDNCTDDNCAATRCEECAMFLCRYCSEFHKKSRSTKHHVLTTIEELKSRAGPSSVAEKIRCGKHKEEFIKLYCKTCQSTICRDCTIVEHRSHDYGFIEDVATDQKEILVRNMSEVQQRQATLQRGIESLKLFDQSLVDENALVVAQVTSHFEELQKVETAKMNELLSKANSITNLKRKQINAQIESLEVALASCKSSVEFTEKAFKNGNDVQVLSMQKYILQSLQDLKKVKDVTQPCAPRDMKFTIPWSIEDTKTNFLSYFVVDECLAVDPDQCEAEFADQGEMLKREKPTSVNVFCFDKNKKRVRSGGQALRANISGVEFDEARIQDNKDGTHTVTFIPRHGGTLKFEATIDGLPAPGCTLTKEVTWVFRNDYGNGELSEGGLKLSGYNIQQECWRIGECSFTSGVHTWKVHLQCDDGPARRGNKVMAAGFGGSFYTWSATVGVTTKINGKGTHAHSVDGQLGDVVCVTVTLNIRNKSLYLGFGFGDTYETTSSTRIAIRGTRFWPFVSVRGLTAVLQHD